MNDKKFRDELIRIFTKYDQNPTDLKMTLTDDQIDQFALFRSNLKLWNAKINLTAIGDDLGIIEKHFFDSVFVLKCVEIPIGVSVVDVGSGGGFPGIPLKIVRPDLKMTLIEPIKKRASFLHFITTELKLDNVSIIADRAENVDQKFDFVLTRFVASIAESAKFCLPILKPNGKWIAYKKRLENVKSEITEVKDQSLSIRIIPSDFGERIFILIEEIYV